MLADELGLWNARLAFICDHEAERVILLDEPIGWISSPAILPSSEDDLLYPLFDLAPPLSWAMLCPIPSEDTGKERNRRFRVPLRIRLRPSSRSRCKPWYTPNHPDQRLPLRDTWAYDVWWCVHFLYCRPVYLLGYILTTYRIPHGRKGPSTGPPVILFHGLLDSSFTWLVNFPGQSLPYLLADAGFEFYCLVIFSRQATMFGSQIAEGIDIPWNTKFTILMKSPFGLFHLIKSD